VTKKATIHLEPKRPHPKPTTRQDVKLAATLSAHSPKMRLALANIYARILQQRAKAGRDG
jgi:hypothetical protein